MPFFTREHSSSATTEAALKILYISQYFPPEMGAPAARVSELARRWVEAGVDVSVLTGFPNHPDGVIRPEYRRAFWRMFCREVVNGIKVARTWLLPFPNRKSYERILNYVSFCVSAAIAGLFLRRHDVVIATSPQLLVGLSGWWVARLKRSRFILEVRDLWPESLAAVGVGKSNSLLHRILGRIAGFLYEKADHIVVVTPAFRRALMEKWSVPAEKISVIQNGVETNLIYPKDGSALRRQLGLQGKFVVSYIGTLGLAHGLETLIAAADKIHRSEPDVAFLLVGDGADREHVAQLAESENLRNIKFVGQQPREEVPEYISASDACLVLLKKSEVFKTVIPTKMLEFMACRKPVILGVDGQAREIMERARCGVYIEPENPDALAEAILRIKINPSFAESMGSNGREYVLHNLSRQSTADEYLDVLSKLCKEFGVEVKAVAA